MIQICMLADSSGKDYETKCMCTKRWSQLECVVLVRKLELPKLLDLSAN
jgi:hypothetical protein